jgi:hypothetical protein
MSETTQPPEITRPGPKRPPTIDREPVHEPVHESVRAEAAPRRRRRTSQINEDRFYFPLDKIPEGSSYEWKRYTVMGQEDPFYIAAMREQGWEAVDPKRHLDLLPPGYKEPHIIKDGLILMERPVELTNEARTEMRSNARRQVREAEQRLGATPDGTLTRDHDSVKPRVTKTWERPVPIED